MWFKTVTVGALMGSLAIGPMLGCESLPGDEKSQGAVIGGAGGALAGAAVAGDDDRLVGALLGGVLGAGGGYLIGKQVEDKNAENDAESREKALRASEAAKNNPADMEAAASAKSADVNADGFVTLDEVVAMEQAGLGDKEMIKRLERTQQYFELTETQEQFLRDRGVNDSVIVAMRDMNRETTEARLASEKVDGSKPVGQKAH